MAILSATLCEAQEAQDYGILTGSTSLSTSNANPSNVDPACRVLAAPPAMLQTLSKYRADDSSKSAIDDFAAAARNKAVQPIRDSVRILTQIAYAQSADRLVSEARAECVLRVIDRWAASHSLTEMRSPDAVLSRDRWVAEIALAARAASKRIGLTDHRRALYSAWFGELARDTIEAYTLRLGPKSKVNNHRYWAGLSVFAIGHLLDQPEFKKWGERSFEIGACQVDGGGFLPAELARGERALDYHVYALRPLAAIAQLAADSGQPLQSKCFDGFKRLNTTTRNALRNPMEFERVAGLRQSVSTHEASYSAALRLESLSLF